MTIPQERTRALRFAGELLREILDADISPSLKEQARIVLRHYPDSEEIERQARSAGLSEKGQPWLAPENERPMHEYALARLLGIVLDIVENSTTPEAKKFDASKWLDDWMQRPQPALGGRKPADLIDTPAGLDAVAQVLRSISSGAYQ